MSEGWQGPTSGRTAETYADQWVIVTHPAFRLGFLDAQHGREFDHDAIMARIVDETPPRALERIGWPWSKGGDEEAQDLLLLDAFLDRIRTNRQNAVELAQYRYEEGRLLVLRHGLRCKAWGHPDYPPRAVENFIIERAAKNERKAA